MTKVWSSVAVNPILVGEPRRPWTAVTLYFSSWTRALGVATTLYPIVIVSYQLIEKYFHGLNIRCSVGDLLPMDFTCSAWIE